MKLQAAQQRPLLLVQQQCNSTAATWLPRRGLQDVLMPLYTSELQSTVMFALVVFLMKSLQQH